MNQPAQPVRVSESMGPKELGSYMRGLREHFKLTQQGVSEQLHIRTRYVAAIEDANYDLMPGKIYARGYVHTYAEFLGLDADQVVKQCFPVEAVEQGKPKAAEAAPRMLVSPPVNYGPNWGLLGVGFVVIMLLFAGYSLMGGTDEAVEDETVAEVPETLLASVRGSVMPRAQNYECLTGSSPMACYFAQSLLQDMAALRYAEVQQFAAEIADAEANPPAPAEETPATETND